MLYKRRGVSSKVGGPKFFFRCAEERVVFLIVAEWGRGRSAGATLRRSSFAHEFCPRNAHAMYAGSEGGSPAKGSGHRLKKTKMKRSGHREAGTPHFG